MCLQSRGKLFLEQESNPMTSERWWCGKAVFTGLVGPIKVLILSQMGSYGRVSRGVIESDLYFKTVSLWLPWNYCKIWSQAPEFMPLTVVPYSFLPVCFLENQKKKRRLKIMHISTISRQPLLNHVSCTRPTPTRHNMAFLLLIL